MPPSAARPSAACAAENSRGCPFAACRHPSPVNAAASPRASSRPTALPTLTASGRMREAFAMPTSCATWNTSLRLHGRDAWMQNAASPLCASSTLSGRSLGVVCHHAPGRAPGPSSMQIDGEMMSASFVGSGACLSGPSSGGGHPFPSRDPSPAPSLGLCRPCGHAPAHVHGHDRDHLFVPDLGRHVGLSPSHGPCPVPFPCPSPAPVLAPSLFLAPCPSHFYRHARGPYRPFARGSVGRRCGCGGHHCGRAPGRLVRAPDPSRDPAPSRARALFPALAHDLGPGLCSDLGPGLIATSSVSGTGIWNAARSETGCSFGAWLPPQQTSASALPLPQPFSSPRQQPPPPLLPFSSARLQRASLRPRRPFAQPLSPSRYPSASPARPPTCRQRASKHR
mmetsp:Transcript_116911/g.291754  ORF Transcript_116911/g.291754 Transcript_116911/m.291754 type:complete len:395 (-) Transcript_116911:992-2176(-)